MPPVGGRGILVPGAAQVQEGIPAMAKSDSTTSGASNYDALTDDELRTQVSGRTDSSGQPLTPAGDRDAMVRQLEQHDAQNR